MSFRLVFWRCAVGLFLTIVAVSEPKKGDALYPICSNNLKTRDVGQLTVESDLMAEVLEKYKVAAGLVGVAVLDTGFDLSYHKRSIVSPSFVVEKGFTKSAEPTNDESGHGTMVAGVIGGKGGMGVAPLANLAVYRVTDALFPTTSSANLQEAARTACDAGYSIINMSWGSVGDEAGLASEDEKEKKFLADMRSKGCLIVKAAGNSSYRKKRIDNDLDDSYLRVGAVLGSGGLSPFSSSGEVYAPGSSIFTLESNSLGYRHIDRNESLCHGSPGVLVNGTSFAAPLTAGVAANLVAFLKTAAGPLFDGLQPEERIQLVNRILAASQYRGTISGYRAIKIAELWSSRGESAIPTVEALRAELNRSVQRYCREAKPSVIGDRRHRATELRRVSSLCADSRPNPSLAYAAWRTFADAKNVEFALNFLRELDVDFLGQIIQDYKGRLEARDAAIDFYATLLSKWGISRESMEISYTFRLVDVDEAITFLPIYYALSLNKERVGKDFPLLTLILRSSEFEDRFSRRELRGSEEDLNRFLKALSAAIQFQPNENLLEPIELAFSKKIDQRMDFQTVRATFLLGMMRLVEGMIGAPEFASRKKSLLELEWSFFRRSNEVANLEVQKAAQENPVAGDLSLFSDLNFVQFGYLDGFFERHSKEVKEFVGKGGKWMPEKFNAFFVPYLLKSKNFLPISERADLAFEVLERIGKLHSWNRIVTTGLTVSIREDSKIGEYALSVLREYWLGEKDEKLKERTKTRYRALFASATNPDFMVSQLPQSPGGRYYLRLLWTETREKNPFVDRDLLHFVARKFLALIPQFSVEMKIAYAQSIGALVGSMVAYLDDDRDDLKAFVSLLSRQTIPYAAFYARQFPDQFTVDLPTSNRTQPAELKRVKVGWMKSVPQLVNDLLVDWIELAFRAEGSVGKNSYWNWVFSPFGENKMVCEVLQPLKDWREWVKALKQKTVNERSPFGGETYMVKLHANYLLNGCRSIPTAD